MIKNNVKVHNNYKVKVLNKEGELVNEGYAENTVLNNFWNRVDVSTAGASQFNYIKIGTGLPSEGIEIDPNNTSLYNEIGSFIQGEDVEVVSELSENTRISTKTMTCTIPASAAYQGDITEVGCYGRANNDSFNSHALFRDSEGNPISIVKTSEDVMIVEVTIYVITEYENNLEPVDDIDIFAQRILSGGYGFLSSSNNGVTVGLTVLPSTGDFYGTSSNLVSINFERSGAIGRYRSQSEVDKTLREIIYNKDRSSDLIGNLGFANHIYIHGVGSVKLPNSNYSPAYTITDLDVGTGDGTQVSFESPIPEFIENTDVIKVDGVTMQRGVDYTLDPKNNSRLYHSSMASHTNKFKILNHSNPSHVPLYYNWQNAGVGDYEYEDEINVECFYVDESFLSSTLGYVALSYSENGEEYTEVARATINNIGLIDLEEPITARYWRVDVNRPSSGTKYIPVAFGKKPSNLVFTNPPAPGAEITISCTVDRPFKSEDFIFDTSYIVKY